MAERAHGTAAQDYSSLYASFSISILVAATADIMLSWIGIGLFVFEEYKMYEPINILGIAFAVCMCLTGVKFLTLKRSGE